MTIGERAAHAIRERSNINGSTLTSEIEKLYLCRKVFNDWDTKGRNPSAYFLQQMALAGYDVIWILTGRTSDGD